MGQRLMSRRAYRIMCRTSPWWGRALAGVALAWAALAPTASCAAEMTAAFAARGVFATALLPNDPQYSSQWHLARINAPKAWDLTQGAGGVVIAIVDSGVDPFHPDLAGKLVAGTNTLDRRASTADQFGHGTKMAGVAGAIGNNGVGIAGVAWKSPIMPIRAADRKGRATSASIAKGIVWAVDHGARVVNVSMDGVVRNAAIREAAEYAFNHGALVVAPSGNCSCTDPSAETPFILSVAATDENDRVIPSSTSGAFVDLSAPGDNILATTLFGLYGGESGTSMASAVVAGVAALMFSVNPELTPAAATELLQKTAVHPAGMGRDARYGHGRVDAFAAVGAAKAWRKPAQESVSNSRESTATATTVTVNGQ
jgi:subtilisin family serine protease